jgi:uncharacterized membrane protein YbaN (DUF454 family)
MTEMEIPGSRLPAISSDRRANQQDPPRLTALKRAAMAGFTALVTVNIWTGCPLLALWVGSQAVGQRTLSMAAVGVVLVVLGALEFVMLIALAWLASIYDELIGLARAEPHGSWLRNLCKPQAEAQRSRNVAITSLEGIVVINVYVAVITLITWYLLFAPHPAPILCPIDC